MAATLGIAPPAHPALFQRLYHLGWGWGGVVCVCFGGVCVGAMTKALLLQDTMSAKAEIRTLLDIHPPSWTPA